eukprot:GHVU01212729.1.p1 GENE.GHVU01212729.1~~GHVU01212729.1.p1  ORF type:complete len:156 (+),score=32.86 GHVU01212729.1:2-469(+)
MMKQGGGTGGGGGGGGGAGGGGAGGGGGVRIAADPLSSTGTMAGGRPAGKRGIPVPSQAGDFSGIRRDVRLLTQLAAAATSPQAATGTSQQSSSAPGNSAAGGQPGHVYVSEEALELLSKRVLDFAADVVRLSASLSPSISLTRAHSVTLAGPVR